MLTTIDVLFFYRVRPTFTRLQKRRRLASLLLIGAVATFLVMAAMLTWVRGVELSGWMLIFMLLQLVAGGTLRGQ